MCLRLRNDQNNRHHLSKTWTDLKRIVKNKVWEFKMVRFFVYELNLHVIYDLFKNISCFEQ